MRGDNLPPAERPWGQLAGLKQLLTRYLPQGGVLLAALFLGSFAMGLLRTRILGQTFGGGAEQDAYIAAFYLPELALDVLVESGLAAPFVPIFLQLRREGRSTSEFGQTILTGAVIAMTVAAAIMFVFAPQTTALIAPGFNEEQRELYVGLFRLMLITPVIFGASLAVGGVLVAERRWVAYGAAPVLYNGGIILGTLLLSASLGIFAAALGAIFGALLHLAARLWGLRGTGFRPWPRLGFRTREVRDFLRLMLPKVVSQPLEIVTGGYFARVASTIAVGTVTAISIARDFSAVPATFIGGSFALAAFPSMSTAYAAGDRRGFLRIVGNNLATIGILSLLAAGTLAVLGGFVVERFLGGGAFDAAAVARTTEALAAFALAVPFESLSHLFSRALYATRNTVLQVLASLAGFGVTVIVSSALAAELGLVAIPVGFAAGSATKLLLLVAALASRVRRFPPPEPARSA